VIDRLRVETSHGEDLRWAVFDKEQLLLQLCGVGCPDGSMDLVGVTVGTLPSLQLAQSSEVLLPLVLNEARQRLVDRLRALVWDVSPVLSFEVLKSHGFQSSAVLHCWSTDHCDASEGTVEANWQPLHEGIGDLGESVFLQLVASTQQDSLDLAGMDPPTPEILLHKWLQLDGPMLLICRQGDDVAGLALLTVETTPGVGTLEYLGIAKTFRRRRLGRQLLASAVAYVSDAIHPYSPWRLNAYCDVLNTPAVRLYQSSAFAREAGSTIWTRGVTDAHNESSGS
jgi:GNAT superfamily N-acetyltransferase